MLNFLIIFALNGMDPEAKPRKEKRVIGTIDLYRAGKPAVLREPPFTGWTTSIGKTKIFVTKGKVSNADGLADIVVGSQSDLIHTVCRISSGNIVHYPFRYGRYGYDYEKGKHKEGVMYFPDCPPDTVKLKKWQASHFIDVKKNPKEVKKILYGIYAVMLVDIKQKNPHAWSIAISSLGTKLGFPTSMTIPVATKAIGEFIQKNPIAYEEIILCVKKQSLVTQFIACIEKFKQYHALQDIFD